MKPWVEDSPEGIICASLSLENWPWTSFLNGLKHTAVGRWLQNQRCWVTHTLQKKNWTSSDIFCPEAPLLPLVGYENKDKLWSIPARTWRRHQGQNIASNLICYFQTLSHGPFAPLGWGCPAADTTTPWKKSSCVLKWACSHDLWQAVLVWPRFPIHAMYEFFLNADKP